MNEIKCPKCGEIFKIDEHNYESIVKQIRDHEFEKELNMQNTLFSKQLESEIELAKINKEKEFFNEINNLKNQISNLTLTNTKLENDLKLKDNENKLAIKDAITDKDKQIDSLNNELILKNKEYELKEKNIKESYESKLKDKDEEIAHYKDFKARQSTKMIGESLEQHCNAEYNKLRTLFKNCYFEKDNDAKSGSKGDFIFRAFDDNNHELVSIMFEMKNEADTTSTKHKNEDFFKELDKDRKEKKCEYAALVSLLEIDNDYYNNGIVDVSHLYPKMYVIRPQFFIPFITLVRDLALKTLDYREELELIKNQNIDITHFEEKISNFKDSFTKSYKNASDRFNDAIKEIDKAIDNLQKIKENLLKSDHHLAIANNKIDDLTIKKITHNNPTMSKMFEELKNEEDN